MCSGPVSVSTELWPTTGASGEEPVADGATSGGAVKIVFTASGSLNSTSFMPLGANVTVNASPRVRAQRSIIHVGATAQMSVCTLGGILPGPGGSRASPGAGRPAAGTRSAGTAEVALAIPTR